MSNERKLRLVQVAKEFKVGLNTVTDFLRKNGVKCDGLPNSLVEPEVYKTLEKEYGSNRGNRSERDSVRERISHKQATVSIAEEKSVEPEASRESDTEIIVKSNGSEIKTVIPKPKILGKIDLDSRPSSTRPVDKSKKKGASQQQPKSNKPNVEPKKVETEKPASTTPLVNKVVEPKPQVVAETPKPVAQPTAEVAAQTSADEKPKDNVFRPNVQTLSGPQVLGTMDVSGYVAGGKHKHKRKRLGKEKVDINKTASANGNNGGGQNKAGGQNNGQGANRNNNQGGNRNNNQGGGQNNQGGNRNGQGGNNQNRQNNNNQGQNQGRNKNNKNNKPAAKPAVRAEISDEEVSKQVKDTLARLTAKGAKNKGAKYRKEKRDAFAERANEENEREQMERSILKVTEFVTVSELATMMDVSVTEVITACMNLGLMVSINQRLDAEALSVVAEEFGYKVEFVSVEIQEAIS